MPKQNDQGVSKSVSYYCSWVACAFGGGWCPLFFCSLCNVSSSGISVSAGMEFSVAQDWNKNQVGSYTTKSNLVIIHYIMAEWSFFFPMIVMCHAPPGLTLFFLFFFSNKASPTCNPPMYFLDCSKALPGTTGIECQNSCATYNISCVSG